MAQNSIYTSSATSKSKLASKKRGASGSKSAQDQTKEQYIQMLSQMITDRGYQVRREKLKRGQGWSVQSGAAAVFGQPTVFIDRNLTLEDQLEVLIAQLKELNFAPSQRDLLNMPEALVRMLPYNEFNSIEEISLNNI